MGLGIARVTAGGCAAAETPSGSADRTADALSASEDRRGDAPGPNGIEWGVPGA